MILIDSGALDVLLRDTLAGNLSGTDVIQRSGIAFLDFGRIALTEHALNF